MKKHIDKVIAWKQKESKKDTVRMINACSGIKLDENYFDKKSKMETNLSKGGFSTYKNRLLNQGIFKVIHSGKNNTEEIIKKINAMENIDEELRVLNNFNESIELVGLTLSAIQENSKIFKNKFKVTILIEKL